MTTTTILALVLSAGACGGEEPGDPQATTTSGTQGCEPTPPDCSTYPGPATLEVGFGTKLTGFSVVADGSEKTVELGPQGLYMYQLAIRVTGVYPGKAGQVGCASDPLVQTAIEHGGKLVGGTGADVGNPEVGNEGGYWAGLTEVGDHFELAGIFTPFSTFDEFSALYVGETVTIKAAIADACGNKASSELTVVVAQ